MEIGKSIAKGKQADGDDVDEVNRAISSLVWMVRAFTIVDGSQNTSTLSPALKVNYNNHHLRSALTCHTANDSTEYRTLLLYLIHVRVWKPG